jgi:hypothetical protein
MNLLIHDIAAAIERDAFDEAPRRGFRRSPDAVTVEVERVWVEVAVVEADADRDDEA